MRTARHYKIADYPGQPGAIRPFYPFRLDRPERGIENGRERSGLRPETEGSADDEGGGGGGKEEEEEEEVGLLSEQEGSFDEGVGVRDRVVRSGEVREEAERCEGGKNKAIPSGTRVT